MWETRKFYPHAPAKGTGAHTPTHTPTCTHTPHALRPGFHRYG